MNPAIIVCSARQFFPKILAFDRSNGKILFMSKKRIKLSDQIRRAVDASGISRYRISKELGISESTMSRFMAGLGGLSMEYLDALADLLEMNLAAVKPKRLAEKPTRATPERKRGERPSLEKEKPNVQETQSRQRRAGASSSGATMARIASRGMIPPASDGNTTR